MKYEGKPIDTAKYKQVDIYSSSKGIYEYYAITLKDEEKYYVATKEEAEEAIDALKKKNSNNRCRKCGYTSGKSFRRNE